ncbi:MAG: ABC transporter substrate-binding protein [Lachnospiraceae bacterium]|nr:ABC transporter substrate-binding protein [Lachnospiraceae bacterium]
MKKHISAAMTAIMAMSISAAIPVMADEPVSFTIFNSKTEIQEYLEEAAAAYGEENNVEIEVYYSNDTVAAHLATRYAASDPYTLSMTDAKDIYSVGAEYGYDMSGQDWTADTDYAITVDGKVLGFPVCIEARGMLYNADTIKAATGEDFDPSSITTLDDFVAFCDKLVESGMEAPTAILKPDWSLAAHYLQQVYEEREDVDGFIDQLYGGTADLINDAKFNSLMDTFDVLMKYNTFAAAPISAEDEQVHQKLSEGEIAFQFGGCWEWNDIIDFDYTGNIGIMPVPQNVQDDYSDCLVGGGSKYFYIDNSEYTTDEQRQAASDFLNWLVYSEEGQTLVSETCGMVSAFSNNNVPCSNDLGAYVKQYVDEGKLVPNYNYDPDDHYSILGANMQEYLAGRIDRETLAQDIEAYWSSVTPTVH